MLIANVVHYDAATISKFVQFNRRSYESGRGTTTSVNKQQNERASVFQSCAPSDGRAKKLDIRMIWICWHNEQRNLIISFLSSI